MTWTLVTGAAKGLGAQIARTLAASGHNVVVHYNTSKRDAERIVKECRTHGVKAEAIQGDLSSLKATQDFIKRYLKTFAKTKYVVNNVGNYLVASVAETTPHEWYDLFETNLNAPYLICRALIPSFKKTKGAVVNIGFAGVVHNMVGHSAPAYAITKSALYLFTRCLASDLATHNVRVNMVSPGHLENSVVNIKEPTKLPMHRVGTLKEVARVVDFLLDDANSYITGQNIDVAGAIRL